MIEASERFAARRPLQATRQLLRVAEWLDGAAVQLDRARTCLHDTTRSLELAPDQGAGAPEQIVGATLQWVAAAERFMSVQDRLGAVMAGILQRAKEGHAVDVRPVIGAPRPAARWFLQYCPPPPAERIRFFLKRRQRPALAIPADAPRRISRGRAPPFVSTCPL